ncbi:MAG: multiheme c-type cytochrome [Ardenticatenaceae bacterium]|nr:multiheme c-type cytochrome [Ardenticatenaceae bacterium]
MFSKNNHRLLLIVCVLMAATAGVALLLAGRDLIAAGAGTVSGIVVDERGDSAAGATVRVRATEHAAHTDANGRFTLGGLTEGTEIEVTAWRSGTYIASLHVTPTVSGVTLTLRPHHTVDHPEYVWTSPISSTSAKACGNCHPMIVSQWENNAHGTAVSNRRFFSLYNGTNLSGTAKIAPGYVDDFPLTAGNCASCHAPGWGIDGYLTTDMNTARDVITAGIHCDYCHKVGDVYLNPADGAVYPNVPGVAGQKMLRPPAGDDIFLGPYDDIPDPDTFAPVYQQSGYCATCHQFSFWGTPIYESYGEWLASPYVAAGVTCQDCHMPPSGDIYFALPEQGGLPHPPEVIPSHLQLGAADADFLREAITMTLSARQVGRVIEATVSVTNTGGGHHYPTDHPGRHLILTVTAADGGGAPLAQQAGSTVPDWGGAQAGRPGTVYAKILADAVTGEAPVVSYWKQTYIASDNRLPALTGDTSVYTFAMPDSGTAALTAELRFRRAFQPLLDSRGWPDSDIVLAQADTAVDVQPVWLIYLPRIGR